MHVHARSTSLDLWAIGGALEMQVAMKIEVMPSLNDRHPVEVQILDRAVDAVLEDTHR